MKTTKITKPILYHGFIVRPTSDGYDLINPQTRQWAHFPTQRYAKWSATLLHNFSTKFEASQPPPKLPKVETP